MSSAPEQLVVEVIFGIEKDASGYPKSRDAEALLCKPLDPECAHCVVASVPFYLRNIAYGDTISTQEDSTGCLRFKEVLNRGGHSVYRVLLHDGSQRNVLITKLLDFNVLLEQDRNLIAFAVPPEIDPSPIVEYLLRGKGKGLWGVQDGFIFEES